MMVPDGYSDVRQDCVLDLTLCKRSSDFRQVPDNQEAYVDESGESSIIVELMEAIETNDLLECCETHFMELIDLNEAKDYQVLHREVLPDHAIQYVETRVN